MQAEGHVIPELDAEPDMLEEALPYWEVYMRLSNSRNVGMSIGGIPITQILAYCDLYYITDLDDRDTLIRIITRLDNHYIGIQQDDKKPSKSKK